MIVTIQEEYENIDVFVGQIKYAKRLQQLLCERLDMDLPKEYELSEIVVEQALFSYIDVLENYYRLSGDSWEEFYQKYHGVKNVPRRLEDFREQKKGSLRLLKERED
ncbi:hypothetical protein CYL18_12105 [Pradoshia eiseniae]|uniref:Uncharacterized protein n=1 Tax=Pradoshia eiseniae TaxID=2064768 RepID=A0A2S7MZ85_9BACI|nr:hypothetical protein [Pradoshia eiseniae]PQD95063.1 hypothetical protein CYL18_12105 [Pradoshia eiseniae]